MIEKIVSIIIVSYNAKELLQRCIESIENNVKINHEVIIVDNDSEKETTDYLKEKEGSCKVIFNNKNVGFSRANNIGARIAKGDILHFLNPDTLVDETINELYRKVMRNDKGIAYATTLNENGHKISGGHLLPIFKNIVYSFTKHDLFRWYIGASLIFYKDDFIKVGRWNESYFMYSEDLDICYKSYLNNVKIKEINSNIIHLGGGSTRRWSNYEIDLKKEKAYISFFKNNHITINYFVFTFLSIFYNLFKYGEKNFSYRIKVILHALVSK